LWLIVLLILVIVGVGVYGYFTTPLPLGLGAVIRTPGGGNAAPTPQIGLPAGARTAAGQPLVLGATNVVIQSVVRNQDLTNGGRNASAPAGSFTVVQVEIQNGGSEPLVPQPADFRLVDERGRLYAVDMDATRAINVATRHRVIFDGSVPPGGKVTTQLAFEIAPDANALTMRVRLGSGEVELPR
jgi:hypothetical protein